MEKINVETKFIVNSEVFKSHISNWLFLWGANHDIYEPCDLRVKKRDDGRGYELSLLGDAEQNAIPIDCKNEGSIVINYADARFLKRFTKALPEQPICVVFNKNAISVKFECGELKFIPNIS